MTEQIHTPNQRIGARLKLTRTKLGVSLLGLCDALGDECSCQELEDYESGRVGIPAERLARCATLLEVPIEVLLHDGQVID